MRETKSRQSLEYFLVNAAFFLSFFPFFKFLPIQAETQPYAGLFAIVITFLYGLSKNKYNKTLVIFLACMSVYYVVTILFHMSPAVDVTINAISYVLPLFVFFALFDKTHLLSTRVYFFALLLWVGIGLVQTVGALSPILRLVDPVFKTLIPRYATLDEAIPIGVRGAIFWSPEPADAAICILLLMATGIFFYHKRRIGKRGLAAAIIATALMVLLNKSGTIALFLLVFAGAYYFSYLWTVIRNRDFKKTLLAVGILTIAVLAAGWTLGKLYSGSQGGTRSTQVLQNIASGTREGLFTLEFFIAVGGFRFPVMAVGYASIVENFGLGHQIAGWLTQFSSVSKSVGIDLEFLPLWGRERQIQVAKPSSYAATMTFDMGFIGLGLILLFLAVFLFEKGLSTRNYSLNASKWALYLLAAVQILFFSLISIPMPWILLCYVYALTQKQREARMPVTAIAPAL